MSYKPEHKQESRQRLVEASGALAKKQGFGATGLDALTAAADMTSGAFYSQFRSKPELLQAIVENELNKTLALFEGRSGERLLKAFTVYLASEHVDHPEQGCSVPSLGAEIARANDATRESFETLMLRLHASISTALGNEDAAWAMICQGIGGILVARAMVSPEHRDGVLNSVLAHTAAFFRPDK